jgi:hypothetical protein
MKRIAWIALAAACGLSAAALPATVPTQTAAPGIAAGMEVVDRAGNPVAQVDSVDGDFLVVRTDRHPARLPRSSFTPYQGKLLFGMTRDQLNAEIERDVAAAQARIAPGAPVRGTGGAVAGTIETVGQDYVVVRLVSGEKVRLPRTSLAPGPDGAVMGVTAAQLRELVAQSASSSDGE